MVDLYTVIDDFKQLTNDTIKHCAVLETVQDIKVKCSNTTECSVTRIASNLASHKVLLAKLGENFFDLFVTGSVWKTVDSPSDLYNVMETVGEDLGQLIVDIFGLD